MVTAAAQSAPPQPLGQRRLAPFWIAVVLVLNLVVGVIAFTAWESTLAPPRDMHPGYRVDFGPDVVTEGCPVRRWSPGEYLPTACLGDHGIYRGDARYAGLEYIFRSRGFFRRHTVRWVRQANDALGVMCPMFSPCLVETVVSERFVGPPMPITPDLIDFRREPMSFRVGYVAEILLGYMPVAVMLGVFLAQRRTEPESA